MLKLKDYLIYHATESPKHLALICGTEHINYAQFYKRVKEEALVWSLYTQKAIVIKSSQTIDFVISYFAIQMIGKVVVPIESNFPDTRIESIQKIVNSCIIPEDISDILFTTGTTGAQKGVMISYKAVIANAENLIAAQGYSSKTVFVISGPLNHIGSLSKIWPVIMLGGTLHITDGIKNMENFLSAFDDKSTHFATFLVPASIRMLIQFSSSKMSELSDRIEFIETGAAPLSQRDMIQLRHLLPKTKLYNTYASTETGIISTYDFSSNDCEPGLLGLPMKHVTVFITDKGTIACKGDMIMSGYVGDSDSTNKVLRNGIVYTSDLGTLDPQKRLHLRGRTDDVINIGGYKVSPIEIENVVLEYPGVKECVSICVNHPIAGAVIKLLYVLDDNIDFEQKYLIQYLKTKLELFKVPFYYQKVDKIEKTYNGKINRKFYKDNY